MADVVLRLRHNGPIVVDGPFTLIDHEGNKFTLPTDKPAVALCRCGHSNKRPFCDGTHKTCGWTAPETAPKPAE